MPIIRLPLLERGFAVTRQTIAERRDAGGE
jgi:hypothetical protein